MVYRKERLSRCERQFPGCGDTNKERGGKTRTCRGSVGVYPIDGKFSFAEGVTQQARKKREVVSGSDFRNDASIRGVESRVRSHTMRKHLIEAAKDCDRRFITRRLDRKNYTAQVPFPALFL